MPQVMALKYQVFEVVVYLLRREVLVREYLVKDNLSFSFYLTGGKLGAQHDIAQQLHRAGKVLPEERGVDECLFFGSIRVELAAHALHAVSNMMRPSFRCSFKQHMLHEVSHSVLPGVLVAGTGVDGDAAV